MRNTLPPEFLDRLKALMPARDYASVVQSFSSPRPLTVRINTLKITRPELLEKLAAINGAYTPVPYLPEALVLEGISREELSSIGLVTHGFIYAQSLASMLPVPVLDPQPGESVLDMCAAPGSKTTQIAARMQNTGSIVAIEAIKKRFYKLKSVITLLGARNVTCKRMDARRFRTAHELFDKVLLDAPCSSEGRFKSYEPATYQYWSLRKIREMARKQRGLLLQATRLLKPGGVLVYSTCTFAPEENEAVIDWLLKKTANDVRVEGVTIDGVQSYPSVQSWQGRTYNAAVAGCYRVLPIDQMEGFFICKLVKKS